MGKRRRFCMPSSCVRAILMTFHYLLFCFPIAFHSFVLKRLMIFTIMGKPLSEHLFSSCLLSNTTQAAGKATWNELCGKSGSLNNSHRLPKKKRKQKNLMRQKFRVKGQELPWREKRKSFLVLFNLHWCLLHCHVELNTVLIEFSTRNLNKKF